MKEQPERATPKEQLERAKGKAEKQQSRKAAKQQSSKAAKQQNSKTVKQKCRNAEMQREQTGAREPAKWAKLNGKKEKNFNACPQQDGRHEISIGTRAQNRIIEMELDCEILSPAARRFLPIHSPARPHARESNTTRDGDAIRIWTDGQLIDDGWEMIPCIQLAFILI